MIKLLKKLTSMISHSMIKSLKIV